MNIVRQRKVKRAINVLLFAFLVINIVAAAHAWKFTHFTAQGTKTKLTDIANDPIRKLKVLLTGIDNPRPVNTILPQGSYRNITIQSNVKVACWEIPASGVAKGTVILFHGYSGNKSALLERSAIFLNNGYNCLLVDFMGSGASDGNQTTIGFNEAEEVEDCYNYVQQAGAQNIYLYGSSMGAVAIMKAIKDYDLHPNGIIIECPFGTMYETVCSRFRRLKVPTFPMAGILVFWGGLENGFWGFGHRPEDDARSIYCPTLLQYGEKDEMVSRKETDAIYNNLQGPKKLTTYSQAGHDDYIKKYGGEWSKNVITFLDHHK